MTGDTWGGTWGACWGNTWGAIDTASGGGGARHVSIPHAMIEAQRRRLIEADEILLLIAGSVAAGLLS